MFGETMLIRLSYENIFVDLNTCHCHFLLEKAHRNLDIWNNFGTRPKTVRGRTIRNSRGVRTLDMISGSHTVSSGMFISLIYIKL